MKAAADDNDARWYAFRCWPNVVPQEAGLALTSWPVRRVENRADTYLLSRHSLQTVVSISAEARMRIEHLLAEGEVAQLWRLNVNARFPLENSATTQLETALCLADQPLGAIAYLSAAHLTAALRSEDSAITAMIVRQSSAIFKQNGCAVDLTQAVFRHRSYLTVGIVATAAADVLETVESLNLGSYPNLHYGEMLGADLALSRFGFGRPPRKADLHGAGTAGQGRYS